MAAARVIHPVFVDLMASEEARLLEYKLEQELAYTAPGGAAGLLNTNPVSTVTSNTLQSFQCVSGHRVLL